MIDINLLRVDKGGNPDVVRESQRKRNASVTLVDEVIGLDKEWIKRKCLEAIVRACVCIALPLRM